MPQRAIQVVTADNTCVPGAMLRWEGGQCVANRDGLAVVPGDCEVVVFDRFDVEVGRAALNGDCKVVVDASAVNALIEGDGPLHVPSISHRDFAGQLALTIGGESRGAPSQECNPWLNEQRLARLWDSYSAIPVSLTELLEAGNDRAQPLPLADPDPTLDLTFDTADLRNAAFVTIAGLAQFRHLSVDETIAAATIVLRQASTADLLFSELANGTLRPAAVRFQHNAWCGPDDNPTWPFGPLPDDPFPVEPPEELAIDPNCIRELIEAIHEDVTEYRIDSIEPADACPGETITISGDRFGEQVGTVRIGFSLLTVDTWSDDEITAVVPETSVTGLVTLGLPTVNRWVCDRLIETSPRPETLVSWTGGRPTVSLIVTPREVRPGEPVNIWWSTSAPYAKVELSDPLRGRQVPPQGRRRFSTAYYAATTTLEFTVKVTNRCGEASQTQQVVVHRPSTATVTGIEVTQGVQHYDVGEPNHIQGQRYQAIEDNALQLIPGKPTLARVYLAGDQVDSFNDGKTRDVTISLAAFPNGTTPGRHVGTVTLDAESRTRTSTVETRRGRSVASANFLLPFDLVEGDTPFQLQASAAIYGGPDRATGSTRTDLLHFNRRGPLTVVPIAIDLTNPAYRVQPNNYATPLGQRLLHRKLRRLAARLPVTSLRIALPQPQHQIVRFSGSLANQSGWDNLVDRIDDIADDYISGDILFLGLIDPTNATLPSARFALGVQSGRAAVIFPWLVKEAVHEVFHYLGLFDHFNETSTPFPADAYGYGQPQANFFSCGEYGVDVETFFDNPSQPIAIASPRATIAEMNGGGTNTPRWTSPYSWTYNGGSLSGGAGFITDHRPDDEVEICHIAGRIDTGGTGRLDPAIHIQSRRVAATRPYNSIGPTIRFVDASGATLATCPIQTQRCGGGRRERFSLRAELPPESVAVVLADSDGNELDRIDAPAPSLSAELETRGDDVVVHIDGQAERTEVWASRVPGVWWRPAAVKKDAHLILDAAEIAGARLRLAASNGLHTTCHDFEAYLPGESEAAKPLVEIVEHPPHTHLELVNVSHLVDDDPTVEVHWRIDETCFGHGTRASIPEAASLGDVTVQIGEDARIRLTDCLER